jgi:hypothetical protein
VLDTAHRFVDTTTNCCSHLICDDVMELTAQERSRKERSFRQRIPRRRCKASLTILHDGSARHRQRRPRGAIGPRGRGVCRVRRRWRRWWWWRRRAGQRLPRGRVRRTARRKEERSMSLGSISARPLGVYTSTSPWGLYGSRVDCRIAPHKSAACPDVPLVLAACPLGALCPLGVGSVSPVPFGR